MAGGGLCAICKKRMATVFITQLDAQGKQINKGICLVCAKKMGLPQVSQLLDSMGITDDDLEKLADEMGQMIEQGVDGFGGLPNIDGVLGLNNTDDGDNSLSDMAAADGDLTAPGAGAGSEAGHGNDDGMISDDQPSGTNTPNFFKMLSNFANISPMESPESRFPERNSSAGGAEGGKDSKTSTDNKNKDKNKYKFLSAYSTDLTAKAEQGLIDNVIGRDREIERIIQIINRRTKNNPALIGEAGVGKTAIAEGLAIRIATKQVPVKLANKRIFLLDLTAMVAGTQFRGQFEGRMKGVLDEVKKAGNIILVIDEVHNIMGAGEAEGSLNAANILKPALSRGEIQVIGATTLKEYRKYIEKDSALERRFQPVFVNEPTIEETIEILKGIRTHYEEYHKVRITDSIIEDAVKMSERYITDRFLPDKAIDVIDEASSRANLRNTVLGEIASLEKQIASLSAQIDEASTREYSNDGELLESFRVIAEDRSNLALLDQQLTELKKKEYINIEFDDIARVIETWTGIPVHTVNTDEAQRLIALESRLKERVIGQDAAVESVARAIRRNRSGFRKKFKPSSFIFVGPTGVGKTELVKQLTIELFGTVEALIRLDMSEYMEKHTVSKLIGSPPGYVGYDEAGQLTEKVRRRPYSVILLDEIEKAHQDVFNMLLQILDDGRLTDSQGRTVNFENTIIIMTSNAGNTIKSKGIGFANDSIREIADAANDALKEIFRPEFLNRVDDVVVFNKLDREGLVRISRLMTDEIIQQSVDKGIELIIDPAVYDYIAEHGYDERYGARPLRRFIQKHFEDEMAELFLRGDVSSGDRLNVSVKDDRINISKADRAAIIGNVNVGVSVNS